MKKTPKGWAQKTVDELFDVQLGKMLNEIAKTGASQFPYLTNTNVQWARFRLDALNQMHFSPKEREKFSLKTGDLIVCEGGEVGRCAIWKNELSPCYFQKALHRLRPKEPAKILSEYMLAYMRFTAGTKLLGDLTSQSSIAHLTREKFLELAVKLPPLPEQQKIADILGTWDEALEKLDALIAAKARRKQALMQQLLTGHRRLPGFDQSKGRKIKNRHGDYPSDWSRVKLGDVTIESSVRADTTSGGIVLSCTKHRGLVPSEEYFGKRVYAADTSAYKVARRGEFAYATNHIEEGSIGYQNLCEIGLVSPIYTVFKTKDAVDDAYFYRLLKSSLMIHLYRVNTSASVDRRGSLRYGEFAEIKINLPKIPEQRAIAAVLDTADAELRLLRQQRTALDHQKRGLMQQLLTGQTRVTITS